MALAQGVSTRNLKPLPRGKPSGIPFPSLHFTDVAAQSGLTFPVVYGGLKHKNYIIETVGCGVAFLDFDNDGWLDIFVLCGTRIDAPVPDSSNRLYKNNRDGTFTDVTEKAGLVRSGWASGVTVGDYNNDGFEDIFITYYGQNVLYRNNGNGTFTDVTQQAGLIYEGNNRWGSGCTFLDYDRDGHSGSLCRQLCRPTSGSIAKAWRKPVLQLQRCGSQLRPARVADATQLPLPKSRRRNVPGRFSRDWHRKGATHLFDDQCSC